MRSIVFLRIFGLSLVGLTLNATLTAVRWQRQSAHHSPSAKVDAEVAIVHGAPRGAESQVEQAQAQEKNERQASAQ